MAHRKRGRILSWLALAVLVLGAFAGIAIRVVLPDWVERRLLDSLAAAGVADAELTVRRIGWNSAEVADLRLGAANELTVARVEIAYSPAGLADGRLDRITVDGLRLRAVAAADGVSLGALDALLEPGGGPPPVLPVGAVALRDIAIDIATPAGPLTVTAAEIEIALHDDATLGAVGEVAIGMAQASLSGRLVVDTATDGRIEATLDIAGGEATVAPLAATDIRGRVHVAVPPGGAPRADARLAGRVTAGPGLVLPGATAALSFADNRLSLTVAAQTADGRLAATAETTIDDLGAATSPFAATAEFAAADPEALRETLPELPMTAGRARIALSASGALPMAEPPANADDLATVELAGTVLIDIAGVDVPDIVTDLSAAGTVRFDLAAGALTLTADEAIRLNAERLDAARLSPALMRYLGRPLGLEIGGAGRTPPFVYIAAEGDTIAAYTSAGAEFVAGNGTAVTADIEASAEFDAEGGLREFLVSRLDVSGHGLDAAGIPLTIESLRLDVAGRPEALDGGFDARLASEGADLPPLAATGLELALAGDFAWHDDRLAVTLKNAGWLRAEKLSLIDGFAARGPVDIAIRPRPEPVLVATFRADGGIDLRHRLTLALDTLDGVLPLPDGGETPLAATGLALDIDGTARWPEAAYTGTLGVRGHEIAAPDFEIAADDAEATVRLALADGVARLDARLVAEALRHTADAPVIAPLRFEGDASAEGDALDFRLRLADPDGRMVVTLSGDHDLGAGTGRAGIVLHRVLFAPGVLQPGEVFPMLAPLITEASGEIAAEGEIAWTEAGLTTGLTVLLDEVSARIDSLRLERVNAVVHFDRLWPPSTPPGQEVAVALLDPGLPLTDGIIAFRLTPEGRIEIEHSEWHWAGGTIRGGAMTIDPAITRYDVTFDVADIDMERIAELAEIDGLAATGRLGGRLPLSVSEDGVVIHRGRLDADAGGGVLHYAPNETPAALQQGGEAVTLMLGALENFRYERLYVTLDREASGETAIGIHLRGANPEFYDGYPVEFNLTVSGALDSMLKRGLEGYRVPDTVRERLRKFGG